MSYFRLLRKTQGKEPGRTPAQLQTLPAPVGGWNARDALQAMKPEDAVTLDNIIPGQGRVYLRPGFDTYSTGIAGSYVETLMQHSPPSGTDKLFAAGPANVYEVTGGGAVGAAVLSGKSNGRWSHVNFATTGGNFLCICNGADGYYTFDGTTWTDRSASVTGATAANFIGVAIHARRLWFIEKNSQKLWYLGTAAIQGAATEFNLGPLLPNGGSLLAVGSWTTDGGDGMDDKLVIVTTKGEVVVYQGTDPDSATDWALVGVFKIAEPLGRRCLVKVGADMGVITSTGVTLLSKVIGLNASSQKQAAITNKIAAAFMSAYAQAGSNFGWQIIEFPKLSLVMINVPLQERASAHQYVVNVETGAWCRFKGMDAACWSLKGDEMYFGGSDGKVYKFGESQTDDGDAIEFVVQLAFNKLKYPGTKVVQAAKVRMTGSAGFQPAVQILVDYEQTPITVQPVASPATDGALWDIAEWDVASWGATSTTTGLWQSVTGEGIAISVVLTGSGEDISFEFNEVDLMFQKGTWL